MLLLAGLPAFVAEAKFSGDAFRLFRWRSPETRMQIYLETVLAREDHAKEVKLFDLGPLFLERYRAIFRKLYREDRDAHDPPRQLGLRARAASSTGALLRRVRVDRGRARCAARITLGEMTMYLMLFRQGQSAVSASLGAIGGMYEDNLYLSTLYEYLDTPVDARRAATTVRGPRPGRRHALRGRELHLSRARPSPRSRDVNLHIPPRRRASRWSARTARARPRSSSC